MIQFKNDRIKAEWSQLESNNLSLFNLVKALSLLVKNNFDKDVVITSIYRSAEEQAELYKDVPEGKKVLNSPHMRWEAVDLRSNIYTETEIKKMLTFLNLFLYQGGQRNVAIYHTIAGNVAHFHLQFR